MSDVIRELFFPTPIYFCDVDNSKEINNKLIKNILKWKEEDENGIVRSNNLGWHSPIDMKIREEFQFFVEIIYNIQNKIAIAEEYKSSLEMVLDNMWANVSQKYAYNSYHIHPNSLWSGVYYVQSPPNCGNIKFGSRETQCFKKPIYEKDVPPEHQWPEVQYQPIEGRVILFPSWLGHEVEQNLTDVEGSDGYRISISFNTIQQ